MKIQLRSARWQSLAAGHLQTVLGSFETEGSPTSLPNSCHLTVPVAQQANVKVTISLNQPGSPLLLLVHGYCGGVRSRSVVKTGIEAFARGYSVARLSLRNADDTHALSRGLFNLLQWDDIGHVLDELRRRYQSSALYAVGFSAGGSLLLNYLAKRSNHAQQLQGAAAVNPPLDLFRSAATASLPRNWLYKMSFLKSLNRDIRIKRRLGENHLDPDRLRTRTLCDYNRRFILRETECSTLDEYYSTTSSLPHLHRITVPTLLIASRNDPLIPIEPFHEVDRHRPNVSVVFSDHGGHLGFIARNGFGTHFWASTKILDFFNRHDGAFRNSASAATILAA